MTTCIPYRLEKRYVCKGMVVMAKTALQLEQARWWWIDLEQINMMKHDTLDHSAVKCLYCVDMMVNSQCSNYFHIIIALPSLTVFFNCVQMEPSGLSSSGFVCTLYTQFNVDKPTWWMLLNFVLSTIMWFWISHSRWSTNLALISDETIALLHPHSHNPFPSSS